VTEGRNSARKDQGRPRPRSRVALLARVAGCIFLLLVATEVVLRFAFGLGNPVLVQSDAACSYVLKPDQDITRFFVHTHVNHFGMRSDEVLPQRKPGSLRLFFVGDSVTYGTSRVDQRSIFTEVLHRELPAIVHEPVELLNASASAWAPDNELAYIRSRGIFQSDMVMLVLNDGDLTQPRAILKDIGDNLPQQRPRTAIGELCSRYILPRVEYAVAKQDAGDRVAANATETQRENLVNLAKFQQTVEGQGGRMVLVYLPFRRDIPRDSEAPGLALHAWADGHDVTMLDLTAAELPTVAKEITLQDGLHLNAKGHLMVARAIEQLWPQISTAAH
jgi:hypothetical protein